MNLIPMPKTIKETADRFPFKEVKKAVTSDERINKAIEKLPLSKNGAPLKINIKKDSGEEYTLILNKEGIILDAEGPEGVFYGIQTLKQLLKNNDDIFCLTIEDKPDFKFRGLMHDVTRGKIPTLDTLKKLTEYLASVKINKLMLYSEHVFDFKEFKSVTQKKGCITAQEIRELEEYCAENYIELIPSISTFSHLRELLNQEEYKDLCILKNYEPANLDYIERVFHHTLDPFNPKSIEVVKSMIDQCCDMFSSKYININCDEAFDLKNGPYKDQDTSKIYLDFVKQVCEYVISKGKTPMLWGDDAALAEYSDDMIEYVKNSSDDIQLMMSNYWYDIPEQIPRVVKQIGQIKNILPLIISPGTMTWGRLLEDIEENTYNIPMMTKLAYDNNAGGILNTNWGDLGNACPLELSLYGITLGAEKSWSVNTEINDEYKARVNRIVYGFDNAVQEIETVGKEAWKIPFNKFTGYYNNCVRPNGDRVIYVPKMKEIQSVKDICKKALAAVSKEKWGREDIREAFIISIEGIILMTETYTIIRGKKIERTVDAEEWTKKFAEAWLERNKPTELQSLVDMFMYMGKLTEPKLAFDENTVIRRNR